MDADQILVLAKGQVVECGSHAALVAAGGLYASMWARQQDSSSSSALPSPAPKQGGDGGGGGSGDGSGDSSGIKPNSRSVRAGVRDVSDSIGSSTDRPQQQHTEVEVVEEAVGEARLEVVGQQEPASSSAGLQSPPPALPPLPRMQRRLNMQPPLPQQRQQPGSNGRLDEQQQRPRPGAAGNRGRSGAAGAAAEAPGSAAAAGQEQEEGEEDAAGGSAAPRVRSTRRCNSSCGHGRHANFWSRVSECVCAMKAP
jgi:hypothetical protein